MREENNFLALDEEIPFAMISKPLIHSKNILNTYEKLILISLFSYAQQGNTAFPSLNTLAREVGTSKPTIIKNLKSLQEKSILSKEKRYSSQGDLTSNLYTLSRKTLMTFLENKKIVKEIYHPSKGDLPPLVKEIYHPSKGDLPPLVKEVYRKKKYKEEEIIKEKGKEREKGSVKRDLTLAQPLTREKESILTRVKDRLNKIKQNLIEEGYDSKKVREWAEVLLRKSLQTDSSGYNRLHTLDLNWIDKNPQSWDSLKEALDLFKSTEKVEWYSCTICKKLSTREPLKACRSCKKGRQEDLTKSYEKYVAIKTENLRGEALQSEYLTFLCNPLIKIQLEKVQEESTRWESFLRSRDLLLSYEEWYEELYRFS